MVCCWCVYEWYVVGVAVSGMLLVWLRDGGLLALARLCGIRLFVLCCDCVGFSLCLSCEWFWFGYGVELFMWL